MKCTLQLGTCTEQVPKNIQLDLFIVKSIKDGYFMYRQFLTLLAILLESQSSPSYSPSPEVAHVLCMYLENKKYNKQKSSQRFKLQTPRHIVIKNAHYIQEKQVPVALPERVKAKLISNFCCVHGIWKILFVSKNKQNSIPQFILRANL